MKVAFYEREITPPLGASIPGYFNERLGSDVKDRLYVKSAVFQSHGVTAAVAAIDGCGVIESVHNSVSERVEEFTGIKKENLIVHFIHTHTGIPRMSALPKSPIAQDAEKGYFDVVTHLIADCVILAYKRLENCNLSYGCGNVHGISFCRDYYMKNGTPQTNPTRCDENIERAVADVDTSLPVLFVTDENGTPKGALINFGCHSDCVGGTEYSGDFSSILAKNMKKQFGSEFVSVFMMAPAGNVNHFDVSKKEDAPDHYIMMGETMFGEAIKAITKAERIDDEKLSVSARWLDMPSREISDEAIKEAQHIVDTVKMQEGVKLAADGTNPEQYNLAMSKSLLAAAKGPKSFEVLIQAIRIGDFVLYSMPGEPYLEYGLMLKEKSPTQKCMIATYSNRAVGYIPTKDLLCYDTIYPARYGANKLRADAGDVLVENLAEMAKELYL